MSENQGFKAPAQPLSLDSPLLFVFVLFLNIREAKEGDLQFSGNFNTRTWGGALK